MSPTEETEVLVPAFESDQVQEALATRRQRKMTTRTIPSLVEALRQQDAQTKDFLVPYSKLRAEVVPDTTTLMGDDGPEYSTRYTMQLRLGEKGIFPLFEKTLSQLCIHVKKDAGKKTTLGKNYLTVLLEDSSDMGLVQLACDNVNAWFERRKGEQHYRGRNAKRKAAGEKLVLVRTLAVNGILTVRAMLSDHYFIYNSLDMITSALGVIADKTKGELNGEELQSMAPGARAFDWHMDPFKVNLGLVNPGFAFDMRNPERGLLKADIKFEEDLEGTQHKFIYPGGEYSANGWKPDDGGGSSHLVFPAAFLSNSETGGGSASVEMMFLESVCDNSCKLGISAKRTHLGSRMEDDLFESDQTRQKKVAFVTSMFADSLRQVFDEKAFEENCLKFLGLFDEKVKDVEETCKWATSQIGSCDDILNDLLKAYEQFNTGTDSVGDVQRALTNVAQDQPEDKAQRIQEFAGDLVTGKVKVGKGLLAEVA